ncbi:MAG: hypothetical protein K0U60_03520 [Actinomycetia bacterium]|nr:hypothetical protein [Actinomycetes bacterium]MCH9800057.1 hypothetical protein [Actinomycetes bacterium]
MSIPERLVTIALIVALALIGGHLLAAGSETETKAIPAPHGQTTIY